MLSIPQNQPLIHSISFNGKTSPKKILETAKKLKSNYVGRPLEIKSSENIKPDAFIDTVRAGSVEAWQELKLIVENLLSKVSK